MNIPKACALRNPKKRTNLKNKESVATLITTKEVGSAWILK